MPISDEGLYGILEIHVVSCHMHVFYGIDNICFYPSLAWTVFVGESKPSLSKLRICTVSQNPLARSIKGGGGYIR